MASCKTDFLCTLLVFEIEAKLLEHNTLFETRRNWFYVQLFLSVWLANFLGELG